jgi:hypothetical protein
MTLRGELTISGSALARHPIAPRSPRVARSAACRPCVPPAPGGMAALFHSPSAPALVSGFFFSALVAAIVAPTERAWEAA